MAGLLHRTATTAYPCYLPILGEFSRSWPCKTCRRKDKRWIVCRKMLQKKLSYYLIILPSLKITGNQKDLFSLCGQILHKSSLICMIGDNPFAFIKF